MNSCTPWALSLALATALVGACGACGTRRGDGHNRAPDFAGVASVSLADAVTGDPPRGQLRVQWHAATDDSTAPARIRYRVVVVPRYGRAALAAGWNPAAARADVVGSISPPGQTEQLVPIPSGAAWDGACCAVRVRAIDGDQNEDSNTVVAGLPAPDETTVDTGACAAELAALETLKSEAVAALADQMGEAVASAHATPPQLQPFRDDIAAYVEARATVREQSQAYSQTRAAIRTRLDTLSDTLRARLAIPAAASAYLATGAREWPAAGGDPLYTELQATQAALAEPDLELERLRATYRAVHDPWAERDQAWSAVDALAVRARTAGSDGPPYRYFETLQSAYARTAQLMKRAYQACPDADTRARLRAGEPLLFIDATLADMEPKLRI